MIPATDRPAHAADLHAADPLAADQLAAALDDLSPGLLGLARCVSPDPAVADRMVETAWLAVLSARPQAAPTRGELVRAMTLPQQQDGPRLAVARRLLRSGLAAVHPRALAGPVAVPDQRRTRPADARSLRLGVAALPLRQRLVVVLHDVHRWPADEVAAVVGLDPQALRGVLARARHGLCPSPPGPSG